MKKFNYFLLTAVILLFTSNQALSITTNFNFDGVLNQEESLLASKTNGSILSTSIADLTSEFSELELTAENSTEFIASNLTLLYSICIALVLLNLIVQIKIIFQMVSLFFQFRKKDEFAEFNFQ